MVYLGRLQLDGSPGCCINFVSRSFIKIGCRYQILSYHKRLDLAGYFTVDFEYLFSLAI